MNQRIYLDNAATSWPKPNSVYEAIEQFQRTNGATAGRGAYREADEVKRVVEQTRARLAELIKAEHRHEIAFTFSGTDSLCTVIFGLLDQSGEHVSHVVTTAAEHNSVLRPLRKLQSEKKIQLTVVDCDPAGKVEAEDVCSAITAETKLVAMTHVSNVTGAIQPVKKVGLTCRKNGVLFLVDAAQSLGCISIDVQQIQCDFLAAPGHKGLFGPLGTGVLYCREAVASRLTPLRYGGSGSVAGGVEQPTSLPEKFESGNTNVPGIVGIQAGLAFLLSQEGDERLMRMQELKRRLLDGMLQIDGLQLYGSVDLEGRTNVFSFNLEGIPCSDVTAILDSNWSIQARSGLHCSPLLHRSIGTEEQGGAVRLSLGLFNTQSQIDRTLDSLVEILG